MSTGQTLRDALKNSRWAVSYDLIGDFALGGYIRIRTNRRGAMRFAFYPPKGRRWWERQYAGTVSVRVTSNIDPQPSTLTLTITKRYGPATPAWSTKVLVFAGPAGFAGLLFTDQQSGISERWESLPVF